MIDCDGIKVYVDKRTELCGIMLRLSRYNEKYPKLVDEINNFDYFDETKVLFSNFKYHKAIVLLNNLIENFNFSYNAPVDLFLQLDENYNFIGMDESPYKDRLRKSPIVLEFVEELKSFVKESQFDEFFEFMIPFYEQYEKTFAENANLSHVIPWMKDFYKKSFNDRSFYINLNLLLTCGSYGGFYGNKSICSECIRRDDEKNVSFPDDNPMATSHFVHEFSHPIINPLTAKFRDNLDFGIPESLKDTLSNQGYIGIYTYVNESIIRAIQVVYMKDNGVKSERIDHYLSVQKRNGFVSVGKLVDGLEDYKSRATSRFEEDYVGFIDIIKDTFSDYKEKEKSN